MYIHAISQQKIPEHLCAICLCNCHAVPPVFIHCTSIEYSSSNVACTLPFFSFLSPSQQPHHTHHHSRRRTLPSHRLDHSSSPSGPCHSNGLRLRGLLNPIVSAPSTICLDTRDRPPAVPAPSTICLDTRDRPPVVPASSTICLDTRDRPPAVRAPSTCILDGCLEGTC
jgi:hypothetical protein